MAMSKKQNTRTKMAALLFSTSLIAAACGSATADATDTVDAVTADTSEQVDEEAMDDEDAMDEDAMDEDAMDEDAMDEDAMDEDAMDDGDITSNVNLEFSGLEPLGDGFVYEGWVVVDDSPISTGRFTLEEIDGDRTYHAGSLATNDDLAIATDFVLTIEPAVGDDPAPAAAKPLGGAIVDGVADLSIAHPAALGDDFTGANGQFVLATPTSATDDDEYSGVWFIDLVDGAASQGLDIPELPEGWVYEGWVVVDGQPVSTGRFVDPGAADDFNGFSGLDGTSGPAYPGEDFIENAPDGLEFPTDLRGATVVLSIEPADDDSPAPFAFKPLAAEIPEGIADHVGVELGEGPGFPTGTATIG